MRTVALAVFLPGLLSGQDFRVNDDTGTGPSELQYSPKIAVTGAGTWLVYWTDFRNVTSFVDIYAHRLDVNTNPVGTDFMASFPLGTDDDCWGRDGVAGGVLDTFFVEWEDDPAEDAAQLFYGAAGQGAFYTFPTGPDNAFVRAGRASVNGDRWYVPTYGRFAVACVFENDSRAYHQDQVWAKRYDDGGGLIDSFRVDTTGNVNGSSAAVGINPGGGKLAITWNVGANLYARLFDGTSYPATPTASLFLNSDAPGFCRGRTAVLEMDRTGGFVAAWTDSRGGFDQIYARAFDSTGAARGASWLVSTGELARWPTIAMDSLGRFTLAWAESTAALPEWHIYAADYTPALTGGFTYRVDNAPDTAKCRTPWAAMRDSDSVVCFVWRDGRNWAANDEDIYGRCITYQPVGVDAGEKEKSGLREPVVALMPGGFTLRWAKGFTLSLYDASGRTVLYRTTAAGETVVTGLSPGVYLARLEADGQSRTVTVTVVK